MGPGEHGRVDEGDDGGVAGAREEAEVLPGGREGGHRGAGATGGGEKVDEGGCCSR